MAHVVAYIPDLLFGSRVQADLRRAGHTVELIGALDRVGDALLADRGDAGGGPTPGGPGAVPGGTGAAPSGAGATPGGGIVLVVDLTAEPERGAILLESLLGQGLTGGVRTLAFYSHVDVEARQIAERANFDLIVPRSRMAREGAHLVSGLVGDSS